MGKKKKSVDVEEYGDEGVVSFDRELTQEEIQEIYEKGNQPEQPISEPSRYGLVKVKCKCGKISSVSEQVVEHGLSWSMLVGSDHFVTLSCPECESELTLFLEEIFDHELPKESN